ncbi:MAG: transporter substrate-binding domain-containing protein [Oscillospiraceae bacterium]|nr:transporter substrate-binding domain-containing protein [Oscillospiraceae bacterium]
MKKLLALALALVLAFTLAACKSADPSDSADPNGEANPGANATPSTDAAPDGDFAYIQGKGKIIVGYTVYAPMNYTDDDGNFTGFDTELTNIVCEKLGLTPDFVVINWTTKEIELAAKTIDVVWNGLTITESRKQEMEITKPYLRNAQVVVMKTGADYSGTASLIGKTVVAEIGSAGELQLIGDDENEPEANLAQSNYVGMELQTACLMEVAAGTAAAAVLDLTLARAMIGEGTDYANLEIVDEMAEEFYGIAFRKGSDLCEMVNKLLDELLADGTLTALAEKYQLVLA